jgi:AraC family transcriptional regulator
MEDLEDKRTVEAEIETSICRAEIVSAEWNKPIEILGHTTEHHLGLALLPGSRNGSACFHSTWNTMRFASIGDIFFLPANQTIQVKSVRQYQQSIGCIYKPAAVARFLEPVMPWTESRLIAGLDIASSTIRNLLFRIGQELRAPGFASETLVEAMAEQALIEVSRYLLGISDAGTVGGLAPWRMKLIDERLRDGETPPSLDELAELCSLSVRHLTRAFRTSRGRSIGDYIAEHRMDQAKMLLLSGMPLKSVSRQIGFSAPSNFATAFRRLIGETPREFRLRMVKQQKNNMASADAP